MLGDWDLALLDVAEYPPEDGATYYENARVKAEHGRRFAGDAWVVGEDSGIEVDGLGGRPGIFSARFGGDDPVGRLLEALREIDGAGRAARYVCELVALSPAGEEVRGRGVFEGRIAREPRGNEGFGYDPIFAPAGQEQTVAELGDDWKRTHSHRALAAASLERALREAGHLV